MHHLHAPQLHTNFVARTKILLMNTWGRTCCSRGSKHDKKLLLDKLLLIAGCWLLVAA
jgi:hypothetical protein